MTIRSFLYLDEYKLYSFSSQLFSGLTEYIITASAQERERRDETTLAAPAKVVAEIARENVNRQERRFLHDHAYNLFEQEMEARGSLVRISQGSDIPNLAIPTFVRITGKGSFIDSILLKNTIEGFNDIAQALAYVTSASDREKAQRAAETAAGTIKDRNQKAVLRDRARAMQKPSEVAKAAGMRQDPEFLRQLAFLIQFGYQGNLQLQIPLKLAAGRKLFSAILRRDALREEESTTIQKFSRTTDRALTIVGLVSQAEPEATSGGVSDPNTDESSEQEGEPTSLKEAVTKMVLQLADVESHFSGRLANEVIVDPIAVYLEVPLPSKAK